MPRRVNVPTAPQRLTPYEMGRQAHIISMQELGYPSLKGMPFGPGINQEEFLRGWEDEEARRLDYMRQYAELG